LKMCSTGVLDAGTPRTDYFYKLLDLCPE